MSRKGDKERKGRGRRGGRKGEGKCTNKELFNTVVKGIETKGDV